MPTTVLEDVRFGAYVSYVVELILLDPGLLEDKCSWLHRCRAYSQAARSVFVASGLYKKLHAFLELDVVCCAEWIIRAAPTSDSLWLIFSGRWLPGVKIYDEPLDV